MYNRNCRFTLLFILWGLMPTSLVLTQNDCYVQLDDASGFDITSFQTELDSAACELVSAFPDTAFSNHFKVFGFGFYLNLEYYDSYSYPQAFLDVEEEMAGMSPYYLLIGRQSDQSGVFTRFWVGLKLPTTGEFSCMDLISPTWRDDLEEKLNIVANKSHKDNDLDHTEYSKAEMAAIKALTDFVEKTADCCDPERRFERSGNSCSACIFTPDEILQVQKTKQFLFDFASVLDDPEWIEDPLSLNASDQRNTSLPLNISVAFGDPDTIDLDDFVNGIVQDHLNDIAERFDLSPTYSIYTFKYPRDCGLFESIWSEYESDGAELKMFFSFVNIDNEFGVLGFHTASNYENSRGDGGFRGISDDDILQDELEGIQEILDESEKSCQDLVFSFGSYAGASYYLAEDKYPFQNEEQLRHAIDLYESASISLDEASYDFGIYWSKEYEAVKYEYDEWGECWVACAARARYRTTMNLCGETIHTLLDICGLDQTLGTICDATNAVLYLTSGDLKNAGLSVAATVPVAGIGAYGVKYGGKLWKPLMGCIGGGGSFRGSNYCRVLSFAVSGPGRIKWVGKESKLRNLIIDNGIKYEFNGVELIYNATKHEVQHLIPWQYCKESTQHSIMKKLAKLGWHPSNPILNGLVVPKNLPNGVVFHHGSHPAYNEWVDDALTKMDNTMPESQLYGKMMKLTDFLNSKIEEAYQNGKSLNSYFKDDVKKFDIINLDY